MNLQIVKQLVIRVFPFLVAIKGIVNCRRQIIKSKKNIFRTIYEILRYEYYWKDPGAITDYFYYGFDKKKIELLEINKYIPKYAHFKFQGISRYREYDIIAYDKRFVYLMFDSMNLPHPEVLLLFFKGIITDKYFRQLNMNIATEKIINSGVNRFFLKPAFSGGTRGTDVITVENGKLVKMNNSIVTLEDISREALSLPSGFLLQCEMKDQHPLLRKMNPDSVNTLRIEFFEIFSLVLSLRT